MKKENLPPQKKEALSSLLKLYNQVRTTIEKRMNEFRSLWEEGDEEEVFAELVFCLLTPQSKAKWCWKAVTNLRKDGLLFKGTKEEIRKRLQLTRFRNRKAEYIVLAQKQFVKEEKPMLKHFLREFKNPFEARNWLVKNVKGMGYKEASHFLRNIGLGEDFAILDRHILKNLFVLGVISSVPHNLTERKYIKIEEKMRDFSSKTGIQMAHLDLLLWYKETGEVFK